MESSPSVQSYLLLYNYFYDELKVITMLSLCKQLGNVTVACLKLCLTYFISNLAIQRRLVSY